MREQSKAPNDARSQTAAPALLKVTLITIAIGLLYCLVVILPQHGRAPNLRQAAVDEEA